MSLLTRITDFAIRPFRGPRVGASGQKSIGCGKSHHVAATALAGLGHPEPKEIAQLVAVMRRDPQVKLAELVLTSNIKSIPVGFAPADDNPRTVLLAQKCDALWHSTLTNGLDFIAYGRVAFEKVYDYDEGLTVYRSLDALPFERTTMELGECGEYAGLSLRGDGEAIPFSAEKSWWLALDAKPLEPHGVSRFLGAPYEVWKERTKAFELRRLFLKRYAIVGAFARIPMNVTDPITNLPVDNASNFAEQLNTLLSGGWVIAPNTRDSNGNFDYTIDFPTIADPAPIDNVIDGLDAEMLRAFGIPEKTIIEGTAVGSYALGDQQMLILYCMCEDILGQMLSSFQKYVVNKLVEVNGTGKINGKFLSIIDAKRAQELAQPLPNGQKPAPGAAGELPTPSGSLTGIGQQERNNRINTTLKALQKMIAGSVSEAMTRIFLGGLNWTPKEIDDMVADAKDGQVDDPELKGAAA